VPVRGNLVTLWSNLDVNGFCAGTVATESKTIVETNDRTRHVDLNEFPIARRYLLLARMLLAIPRRPHWSRVPAPPVQRGNVDMIFGSDRGDHELHCWNVSCIAGDQ
jgi:hypothetical protein